MKRLLFSVVLGATGLPLAMLATDSIWENSGVVSGYPVIDATNFVNDAGATMTVSTTELHPFDFSNTENFTNRGTMTSTIGWQFDTAPSGYGQRRMAANFFNDNLGVISALDLGTLDLGIGFSIDLGSKLYVSATNVINKGYMTAGAQGILSLEGRQMDLTRGRMQINTMTGIGTVDNTNTYVPDVAIYDDYWGLRTNNINTGNILNSVNPPGATSPNMPVTIPGGTSSATISSYPGSAFVYSNGVTPILINATNIGGGVRTVSLVTNYIIQVAFVGSPNIAVNAYFSPSTDESNLFNTVEIGMTAGIYNPTTDGSDGISLFLSDRLASEPGRRGLAQNTRPGSPPTYRPGPYLLSRLQQYGGTPANFSLGAGLLFNNTMSNATQRAAQAAYGASVDKVVNRQPVIPQADITNVAGRIEIKADSLNLTRTRLRSDGLVTIKTPNLINSSNAVIDAFHLSYDLGATNGDLRIRNMALSTVDRFGGTIACWSGTWSNTASIVTPNYEGIVTNMPDPNDPTNTIPSTNWVQANLTNSVTIGFHTLIVDASGIIFPTPVTTHMLNLRSTNSVVLSDPFTIDTTFFTDAPRFTLEPFASIIFTSRSLPDGTIINQDWTSANAPNLLYLTNRGFINIPNLAHFGDDRPVAYSAFVNDWDGNDPNGGVVYGNGSLSIRSSYFEQNGGLAYAFNGPLSVNSVTSKMANGCLMEAWGDIQINAKDMKFTDSDIEALNGTLNFTITNSLSDAGPYVGSSSMYCYNGFRFTFANATGKPQIGDLLGTQLESDIPQFVSVPHWWPGNDRGASNNGYTNNLALGFLVLFTSFESEAVFIGTGISNAMYVDYLYFGSESTTNEVAADISIAPNLTIYFADSNLPAEQLDGMFGGHLRWVSSYAGYNSSVSVTLANGQVVQMNRALRYSTTIDTDGDGVPNASDPNPLDPSVMSLSVSVAGVSPLKLALSWMALPNTVYDVEYKTDSTASWKLLKHYTNNAASDGMVTVYDQVPPGSPQRFYRVSYGK